MPDHYRCEDAATANMGQTDPLRRIPVLYHFTDRRNLAMIRELEGVYPTATLREMGIEIPAPGGNQLSRDLDEKWGLDKYVHLCFRPKHPMEFVARRDGRLEDPIFLAVSPEVLRWEGVKEVLYTWTDWRDPAVKARLDQAEKCEILVPEPIPLELIRNLPND